MNFRWARVGAIFHKELRDYRRNRFMVFTMAVLPLIFVALPMIQFFTINTSISSARLVTRIGLSNLVWLIGLVAACEIVRLLNPLRQIRST